MKESIEEFRSRQKEIPVVAMADGRVKRRKVVEFPSEVGADQLLAKADEALNMAKDLFVAAQDMIAEARRLKKQ